MTTAPYRDVLERVQKLDLDEQLHLLEALVSMVKHRMEPGRERSIMELEGLGEHVWRDPGTGDLIDAQEYVNKERSSWRG